MKKISLILLLWLIPFTGCAGRSALAPVHQNQAVQKAAVNGVELGYRTLGQGPPLLMIMGYAGTMETWDSRLVSALAETHWLILYDHRGTGHSTSDNTLLTMGQMTADAVRLLDHLGIEKVDVFGWSMGSVIAQEMALAHPGRVNKLILYATAVDMMPVKNALDAMARITPEQFAARLFPEEWKQRNPDIYSRLPGPAKVSQETIARQYQALISWPGTRNRLAAVTAPTLVLVGEADRITPVSQSLDAAGLIKGAWVARFRAADHWLMYQAPEQMARTIDFFMSTEPDLLKAAAAKRQ